MSVRPRPVLWQAKPGALPTHDGRAAVMVVRPDTAVAKLRVPLTAAEAAGTFLWALPRPDRLLPP